MKQKFISGVVEGFYGRPWSTSQRLELFQRLEYMGLNTYLYAPKDDFKHRQMWRDLYSVDEITQLKYLIDASKKYNITFVYAISPGVDITFSNTNDVFLLKQKMNQVLKLGCEAFALLFDDISPDLRAVDKPMFESVASAQASVTNEIYDYLKQPRFFLFCPTEYCSTRATPSVRTSDYLLTIGAMLKPEIDIMWTGPKVVSKFITLASILELCDVLKRQPIIWDNIHANDYDQRRLFLGPYCGRSSKLIPNINGVLTNPNCEFEANFVAMHTLAQWLKSTSNTNTEDGSTGYKPSAALRLALTDWLDVLYQNKDLVNESKSSITCASPTDYIKSPTALASLSHNSEIVPSTASQIFSPDNVATGFTTPITDVPLLDRRVSVGSTSISDTNNDNSTQAHNPDRRDSSTTLPVISVANDSVVSDKTGVLKSSDDKALTDKNEMETMDNISNTFPLTPMETEDYQSEGEHVVDPMAMQVDTVDDAHSETMDVIDDAGSAESNNDSISSNTEESEMNDRRSNESSDLGDTTFCNRISKLTVDDLSLLVHLFFLPYEHGPLALKMLDLMHWIKTHAHFADKRRGHSTVADSEDNHPDRNSVGNLLKWHSKAKEFQDQVELVRNLVDKMCNIPNRSVLFDLYPYIQEVRHVIGTLSSYVKWMGCTPGYKESFLNDDHEPWMFPGGLISEFQRMFVLEGANDLFPNRTSFLPFPPRYELSSFDTDPDSITDSSHRTFTNVDINISPSSQPPMFMIRPYSASDKQRLYELADQLLYIQLSKNPEVDQSMLDELRESTLNDLAGDRYLGHFLNFSPDSCLILENEHGDILGYALGSISVQEILDFRRDNYREKMRSKYESEFDLLSQVDQPQSKPQSIVMMMVKSLFNDSLCNSFETIIEKSHSLIHIDIMDCYTDTDLDTVRTMSQRLLVCLCRTLKTKSVQNLDVLNDASPNPVDQLNDKLRSDECVNIGTPLQSPTVLWSEVDSINTYLEEFYKVCGFTKRNAESDLSSVSIMSKAVCF